MAATAIEAQVVKKRSRFRPAAIGAYLAVVCRIVVAPVMLIIFATSTRYMTTGKFFIVADESYFAYSQMDPVMGGGCSNCDLGCRNVFIQLAHFGGAFGSSAILSKPQFEDLYTMTNWADYPLSDEAEEVLARVESDPNAYCMGGVNEWASPITSVGGDPQLVLDVVKALNLSVIPMELLEAKNAIATQKSCPTRWAVEAHIRMFMFQAVAHSSQYSSISAADLIVFPEYTDCRGAVSNDGIVGSKLALPTAGTDLLEIVPELLTLFPYSFKSSLKDVSRSIPASNTIYKVSSVTQPLLHAYFGACRVREVNTTGVYIEDTCEVDKHWENYGLMVQSPDDISVCSTGTDSVCVHNYYNSLWEFVGGADPAKARRYLMEINVFRNRYADTVELSVLPSMVVIQILLMGLISLYQTMSHKRSVLLTQIWAYRCQNGRMQVMYLAQITYHFAYNSDRYFLGMTTGSLSTESVGNLTLCFFAFTYSFVNLIKARSGEQQLDRYFRLTWEVMQIFTTTAVGVLLYQYQFKSINALMTVNGQLLRKTSVLGAKYCNLSDSCIIYYVNLAVIMTVMAVALSIFPFSIAFALRRWDARRAAQARASNKYMVYNSNGLPNAPTDSDSNLTGSKKVASGTKSLESKTTVDGADADAASPPLTSFETNCLGVPFTRLFNDCDDFSHVVYRNKRCTSVEAVLLTGFLFYGKNVYQAPAVLLLLLARLIPRKILRTFNQLLVRWHVDPLHGTVSYPLACTWYAASAENNKWSEAVPIA